MYTHFLLKYIDFYAIYNKVAMDFLYFSSDTSPRDFHITNYLYSGADPGFFFGGGALVSCSTSTPINHIVVFFFCRILVVLENRRSSHQGEGVRTPSPPRSNTDTLLIFFLV